MVLVRVQQPGAGEHGGSATCVDVMHNTVERFGGAVPGRSSDENSLRSFCICGGSAATAAAVLGFQGLMKEVVLALENVRPEAACRTCCMLL